MLSVGASSNHPPQFTAALFSYLCLAFFTESALKNPLMQRLRSRLKQHHAPLFLFKLSLLGNQENFNQFKELR